MARLFVMNYGSQIGLSNPFKFTLSGFKNGTFFPKRRQTFFIQFDVIDKSIVKTFCYLVNFGTKIKVHIIQIEDVCLNTTKGTCETSLTGTVLNKETSLETLDVIICSS